MITIIIYTYCVGYACRADKNPYQHDRRADNNNNNNNRLYFQRVTHLAKI